MLKPIRVVQVSDIHLSRKRAYFNDNFAVFQDAMRADPPELIVYSGDVSFDGPDEIDDLVFARQQIEAVGVPWIAIPGNHDIGEPLRYARLDQPVGPERISRWREIFGPQWWSRDIGAWRIIGIDTALLASDLEDESEQNSFLDEALRSRGDRSAMLVMHLPPYSDDPEDAAFTTQCVPHEARKPLLARCAAAGVRVIACGHLHVYRRLHWRDIEIVWSPATSFCNVEKRLEAGWGFPRAGYIEWSLDNHAVSHRLVEPPRMITHDIGRWNAEFGSSTKMPPRPL